MSDVMLRDEVDNLYLLTERLKNVSRPIDQLEAVSDYAKRRGACHGILYYIEQSRERIVASIAAEWAHDPAQRLGVGLQLDTSGSQLQAQLNKGNVILFCEDPNCTPDHESVPEVIQNIFKRTNTNSAALLPLKNNDRAVGMICFLWYGPHEFTERETRIFNAILRLAAPVIDSVRLLEQANRRTVELEIANREMDIVYGMIHQLTSARTPVEQLEAVSEYARITGASAGQLFYMYRHPNLGEFYAEVAAEWSTNPRQLLGIGTRMNTLGTRFSQYSMREQVVLVEDPFNHPELEETDIQIFSTHEIYSIVQLILESNGYLGVVAFLWSRPQHFTERDRRIYTALRQQMAPVVASIRMHEETEKRALELERVNDEIDTLYNISSRLSSANTYSHLLDAISDFGMARQATYGAFINLTQDNPGDTWQTMSEWRKPEGRSLVEADTMMRDVYEMIYEDIITAQYFVFITTTKEGGVFSIPNASYAPGEDDDPPVKLLNRYGVKTLVIIPLRTHGEVSAIIVIEWDFYYKFTEEHYRIYKSFVQQVTPVLESIKLMDEIRIRATRAETILKINMALSKARDENEIMEAVALYAATRDVIGMVLTYFDNASEKLDIFKGQSAAALTVWLDGKAATYNPTEHEIYYMDEGDWYELFKNNPEELFFVENIETDPRISPTFLEKALENARTRAMVAMPLYNAGRRIAFLTISWAAPQTFNDEDKYIFQAINQSLPAVVASRRAYIAQEEARKENELLYQMGEAINAARTYQEIVEAIALIDPQADAVTMELWEHIDYEKADYFEVVGVLNKSGIPLPVVGDRFARELFPVSTYLAGEAIWVIEDTHADSRMDDVTRASWDAMETRALISTTVHFNGKWAGGVAFHSTRPRTYTERDKRLAAGVGELVTSAVDRIRLQMESENSRKRAETLARINAGLSQATNEDEILAAVAPLAEDYDVAFYSLNYAITDEKGTVNGVDMVAVRSPKIGPMNPDDMPMRTLKMADFPLLRHAYEHPYECLCLEGINNDQRTGDIFQAPALGWPSSVLIPLHTGDGWQGILMFVWSEPQEINENMRSIFRDIRPAASSVVTSRRAYLAQRQRAHELETVAKVSAAVTSILNVNNLVKTVASLARTSFTDYRLFVYLLDENGRQLNRMMTDDESEIQRSVNAPGAAVDIDAPRSLIAHVAKTRQGVIVNDITHSDKFILASMLPNARSEMAVPMINAEKLIGVIDVQSTVMNRFTQADILVMSTLADMIAVAVQNAHLYERAQKFAALEERNRLARELHDSVSQALYGIALGARTARTLLDKNPSMLAEPLDYILSLSEAGLTEMRSLIFELRPETLENEGLIVALTKQAASLQTRHNITVETNLCAEPQISLDMKETLYRIAREALHNTVKHAQATVVQLFMEMTDTCIKLCVSDNGVGFDPSGEFPGHLGLESMKERTSHLRGTVEIISAAGEGTQITVKLPLE